MLRPLQLTNRPNSFENDHAADLNLSEPCFEDEILEIEGNPNLFNRALLNQAVTSQRSLHHKLSFQWRAANRGSLGRGGALTSGDIALSLFCLILAAWILLIWQSEAPFWWVPGLALFFGVAAVAALHDAIWMTPQSHKAQLRRQLRHSQERLRRLSNRLAMIEVKMDS